MFLSVQTTTSGRGGVGNAQHHVLEKGVFERVIAHEDAVIRSYRDTQAMKTSRTTGRGGAGNIKRSKEDLFKDGCECHPNIRFPFPLVLYLIDDRSLQLPPVEE